ncbi:MAG: hypothetical protein ACM3NO_04470 [Deltaproteobacteria bacterium]
MDEQKLESPAHGHETSDANVRAVVKFAVGLFMSIVASLVIVWVTFNYFVKRQGLGPPASPFENTRKLPPPGVPVLEAKPAEEYKHYFERQQEQLRSYGWLDQKDGIVHMPIDRAMDLLVQHGLPVQKETGEIQPDTVEQYTVPKGYVPEQ